MIQGTDCDRHKHREYLHESHYEAPAPLERRRDCAVRAADETLFVPLAQISESRHLDGHNKNEYVK